MDLNISQNVIKTPFNYDVNYILYHVLKKKKCKNEKEHDISHVSFDR